MDALSDMLPGSPIPSEFYGGPSYTQPPRPNSQGLTGSANRAGFGIDDFGEHDKRDLRRSISKNP